MIVWFTILGTVHVGDFWMVALSALDTGRGGRGVKGDIGSYGISGL